MHDHAEVTEIVEALRGQLPQAQTGSRGATPTLSDTHLRGFVSAALQAYDEAHDDAAENLESAPRGAMAAPTPEEKKARRKAFVEFFLNKILPLIIAGIGGGMAPTTAPEGV